MSSIQAVMFPIETFKLPDIINFLHKHNMKPIKEMRREGHFDRVRLEDPKHFKNFSTKILSNNIHFIIGYY
jgi:hypothetical protein